jgi:hypothetical protein
VLLGAIDVGLLAETAWISLVAGLAVCVLFSLVVFFGARSAEARRGGSGGLSVAYLAGALLTFAAFGAVVGYGVQIMLSKG